MTQSRSALAAMTHARLWSLLVVLLGLSWSDNGHAYHVGSMFSDSADAGGGGGIFYLGMPLERGWDCTMCHVDPPGRMKLDVRVEPNLFKSFRYEVGAEYVFTVRMVWEEGSELGRGAGRSNFNALSAGVADADGIYAGTLQGGSAFDSSSNGGPIASSVGDGVTQWSFRWFAPDEPGRGTVKLYLGAVDGNGANSEPELTRSDPFGDDVFMAAITLEEGVSAGGVRSPARHLEGAPSRVHTPRSSLGTAPPARFFRVALAMALLMAAALLQRRDPMGVKRWLG